MKRNIIFICVLGGIILSVAMISWAEENEKGKDPAARTSQTYIEKLKRNAEAGDARAQYILGGCYYFGQGVKQDYRDAVKWSRKAAEQGVTFAQYMLGQCYYFGRGVERDYGKAVKWFRKAAEQGDADAQVMLGGCYYKGKGIKKDYLEAVKWYRKAAEQGNASAQLNLGVCYAFGQGVKQSDREAVKWYRKAAEQGNASAQFNLGFMYDGGNGVKQDYKEAVKWYRKAAEQGYANAQLNLGVCYAFGQGVKQSDREAVKWYRKAAEQGNGIAQYKLGLYYEDGKGVKQDYREAVKWYRKAAEQGDTTAQFSLGLCYADGQGIERDYRESVKWWRKAAEHGNEIGGPNAQFNLGLSYYKGQGVIEDYTEAYKWFLLAGMNGKDVSEIKNDLKKEMTFRQIAEAQQRAKEFAARKDKEGKQTTTDEGGKDVKTTGTGFFISSRGYIITSYHVVDGAKAVKILTKQGTHPAKVINTDSANDIAILKVQGQGFGALPLVSSGSVKTGDKVFTIGFPNVGLQGFEPKYTEGVVSSLSGAMDSPRFFQISTPVQPGNSGGPLVDEKGCIVGVITARLSERAALLTVDALPENVNYALKSSYVLAFLEALPEVDRNPAVEYKAMPDERSKHIKKVKQAVVLVLCY